MNGLATVAETHDKEFGGQAVPDQSPVFLKPAAPAGGTN
jgi:hypothetical protein